MDRARPANGSDPLREFGAELRRLRKDAQLTQGELAQRINFSRTYVTNTETGREKPSERFVRAVESALGRPGGLLSLYAAIPSRPTAHPSGPHTIASQRFDTAIPTAADAIAQQVVGRDSVEHVHTENRADLAILAAAESRSQAARVGSAALHPATIDQVQIRVVHIAQDYVHTSPSVVFRTTLQTRDLAYGLLERTRRPDQQRDLYLSLGQLCGLLASASFDLGYYEAAAEHAESAWIYANHIGHSELSAWLRGMQALIAYWSGDPVTARGLAQAGKDHATSATAQARLHSIHARAAAHLGDAHETKLAIQMARDARAKDGADELCDVIGGEFGFDVARQARCNGSAYLRLGAADSAIEAADNAISIYRSADPRDRHPRVEAEAHVDLAAAYLLKGELDAAEAALDPVFDLPPLHRVTGVKRRVDNVTNVLERSPALGARRPRELSDRLRDFAATAIPKSLPSNT